MTIIKLENICKKYDEKTIFDKFSLEIDQGEFISIMGSSGAGKSTLLNIIGLLEKADSGNVIINGYKNPSMYNSNGRTLLRNHLAYLFQNYGLIENESVFDNLLISIRFIKISKSEKKQRIYNALAQVGLAGVQNKKVYKLSGGEQQRIAIAKIILKESDIILADEPTGSLDENNKKEVLKLLKSFNEEGKTVVVVTHDPEVGKCAKRNITI